MVDVDARLLGPLLDAVGAWVRSTDPAELPPWLRRLSTFDPRGLQRGPARATLRRVLDDDALVGPATEGFRADRAVVALLREYGEVGPVESVGRAASRDELALLVSMLWACRPSDWEVGVGVALERDRSQRLALEETRTSKALTEQIDELIEANRRAETAHAVIEREREELVAELASERSGRRDAIAEVEAETTAMAGRVHELEAALADAHAAARAAERHADQQAKRARDLEQDRMRLRAERDAARKGSSHASDRHGATGSLDPQDARRLDDAIDAADALGETLRTLLERIAPERARARRAPAKEPSTVTSKATATATVGPAPRGRARPEPTPGVSASSPEGIVSMLRRPDVVLVVDGYNVSRTAWSDAPAVDQRERLVRALDALGQQTGASIVCVFDGDAQGSTRTVRGVQVVFSNEAEQADDVVVAEVASRPARTPVVVASSDAWVGEEASRLGAVVVAARALLEAMRVAR